MLGRRHISLIRFLPYYFRVPLFGDRKRYGACPFDGDACWEKWCSNYAGVVEMNKSFSVSTSVYESCYKQVARFDLDGLSVLEIGPGDMGYLKHLTSAPAVMDLVDVDASMLCMAREKVARLGIPHREHLLEARSGARLPMKDGSVDMVLSFFVFEHVYPVQALLDEICRVLKPGGVLLGGIPCEGGVAWGLGRLLTTRRWYRAHSDIDFDKVICWEHPNFADHILNTLGKVFEQEWLRFWPLCVPVIDLNLTVSFLYKKSNME